MNIERLRYNGCEVAATKEPRFAKVDKVSQLIKKSPIHFKPFQLPWQDKQTKDKIQKDKKLIFFDKTRI